MHSYGHTFAFFLTNAKYMYFQWSKVSVFKQGDVVKQMFQKGYKTSLRMYLNLCNAKFLIIEFIWGSNLEFTFLNSLFNMMLTSYFQVGSPSISIHTTGKTVPDKQKNTIVMNRCVWWFARLSCNRL